MSAETSVLFDAPGPKALIRHRIIAAIGVVLTLLLVDGPGMVWLIYLVTFGYGLAAYLTGAAQSGLLRDLLPDEELGSANGIFSSIDNGMRIVSPALGTGLYVLAGPAAVVALSVAGFAVMAIMLLTVRIDESEPQPRLDGETYWHEITAGFRALLDAQEDIEVVGYQHHPSIKAPVAV